MGSFSEVDKVAKLIPDQLGIKLAEAVEQGPNSRPSWTRTRRSLASCSSVWFEEPLATAQTCRRRGDC